MSYINIGLIFIAGLNVGLALLIWLRNPKNKINISYALTVLFVGLWTFGVAMFRESDTFLSARLWTWMQNGPGSMLVVTLLLFSIYFPYQSKRITSIQKVLIWLSVIAVLYVVVMPGIWYSEIYLIPSANDYKINLIGYSYFVAFFLFYISWAFYVLVRKYLSSEGFQKTQLKYTLLATSIFAIFGTFNSVILPIWINAKYNWIGPYFSILMIIVLTYYIFKKE